MTFAIEADVIDGILRLETGEEMKLSREAHVLLLLITNLSYRMDNMDADIAGCDRDIRTVEAMVLKGMRDHGKETKH